MATTNDLTPYSSRFLRFGEIECRGYEPLYEKLAQGIADDRELLAIAAHARPGQPPANMLFGAVQFLLLSGVESSLTFWYRTLSDDVRNPDEAFPVFQSFCLDHRDELIRILEERRVQTNEVGRAAALYPAFSLIASVEAVPMGLIEIGASAGLNLNWDRFRYRYGGEIECGEKGASVVIETELRGGMIPPLPESPPPVASRVGIDLNPIDIMNHDDALWLRSLVWPEHAARAERLRGAIEVAREHPPRLVAGNGLDHLPALLLEMPDDILPVIFHTHALYQFPEDFSRLTDSLRENSHERTLYHLSMEKGMGPGSDIELMVYRGGEVEKRLLAVGHPHGTWIEWIG